MVAHCGFIWATPVTWEIPKCVYKHTSDGHVLSTFNKKVKDIIVTGTHPKKGPVIYSRHETAHGGGGTHLWWYEDVTDARGKVVNKHKSVTISVIMQAVRMIKRYPDYNNEWII